MYSFTTRTINPWTITKQKKRGRVSKTETNRDELVKFTVCLTNRKTIISELKDNTDTSIIFERRDNRTWTTKIASTYTHDKAYKARAYSLTVTFNNI